MSKFKHGDKVKIVRHPTRPQYCGLEGRITAVREIPTLHTTGPMGEDGSSRPKGKQWRYNVEVASTPLARPVLDLFEEWLELL